MKNYKCFSEAITDGFNIGKDSVMIGSFLEVDIGATKIEIGAGCKFSNAQITVMGGGELVIGDSCHIRGRIIVGEYCKLHIDNGLSCNSSIKIHLAEKGSISIGKDCLFANPQIFNSDMHSIFSEDTGLRINKSRDVVIGDRVWLATNTLILKGAEILRDSVVGAGSVVNGRFESNCVIAGNPARVVKSGISWSRAMIDKKGISFSSEFSSSEYRKAATEFDHLKVIIMGMPYLDQWEDMDDSNYYIFYYLARSLLLSHFNIRKTALIDINNKIVSVELIKNILNRCYELSDFKNVMCGSYYVMILEIIGEKDLAKRIYSDIHKGWPHIENKRFQATWSIGK